MAFNQNAYDFVLANIENPFAIAAAMADLGISTSQLADAIGLDTSVVNSFFDNAGVAVVDDTGSGFVDDTPAVVETPSVREEPVYYQPEPQQVASTTPVQPQLNISDEVKNIKDAWFSATGTQTSMSDKEIETFIRNNPETYNLSLLNVIDQYEKEKIKQDRIQGLNELAETKDGKTTISLDKLINFATQNNISDQELLDLVNISADDLKNFKASEKIRSELLSAQETGNQLTTREILDIAAKSNLSLEDFVTKYFGNNSETLATLQAESAFTPQERSWRETAQNLKDLTSQQVLDFQAANKLSDKDMNRIFGIKESDLNTYRLTTSLQGYAGEDKTLNYEEIIKFAQDNNITLSEAVDLIGTKEERPALLSKIESYVQQEAARPKTITSYDGKTYDTNTILKLVNQIKQNFDTTNSRGGAFGIEVDESTNVGFAATEAENVLGRKPTAADMVFLDMARNLASQGITDVADIAKYKPTEVYESTSNPEGGGELGSFTTRYIDPATGKEFYPNFGGTYAGEGGTGYAVNVDESGKPVFATSGYSTSDAGTILPIVSFALMAVPVIGQAVGAAILGPTASAATATALGNAVINAGIQIATGVDPVKAIGGAAASMFGATVSPDITALINESIGNPQVSNIITKAIEGGVKGVLTDQDVGKSALSSLTGQALGGITQQMIDDPTLAKQIASSVSMGTSAAVAGLDVPTAIMSGLIQGSRDTTTKPASVTIGTAVGGGASTGGVNLSDDLPGDILNPISPSDEEIISAGRKLSGSATDTVDLVLNDPALQLAIQDAIDADNRSIVQSTFAKYPDVPFTQEQVEAWVQWAKQNPDIDLAQEIDKGFRANAAATTTSGGAQTSTTNVATDAQQDVDAKTVLPGGRVEVTAPSDTAPIDLTQSLLPSDASVANLVAKDQGLPSVTTEPVTVTSTALTDQEDKSLLPTVPTTGPFTPSSGGPVVVTSKPDVNSAGTVTVTAKKDGLLPTEPVVVKSTPLGPDTEPVVVTAKKDDELFPTDSLTVTAKRDDLLPTDAEIIDLITKETNPPGLLPTVLAPTKPVKTVPPGSRVQEDSSLLPLRPGLSEGYSGDIEGTPEEEQQPVWNVRSLKLRRALGI